MVCFFYCLAAPPRVFVDALAAMLTVHYLSCDSTLVRHDRHRSGRMHRRQKDRQSEADRSGQATRNGAGLWARTSLATSTMRTTRSFRVWPFIHHSLSSAADDGWIIERLTYHAGSVHSADTMG